MARVVTEHLVDQAGLERLRRPRVDWLVAETIEPERASDPGIDGAAETADTGPARFGFDDGPLTHWQRTLVVAPVAPVATGATGATVLDHAGPDTADPADNPTPVHSSPGDSEEPVGTDATERFAVTETVEFTLALPFWRHLASPLIRWQLKRPQRDDAPFWAPPERFDRKGAESFALLIFAALAAAYLGTLLSQTITFVAEEFDQGTSTQGWVTSMTRGGALLALLVVRQADRVGRRRMLLVAGAASAIFAVAAAASPNIWFFGATQTVSRGFATGFGLLIGVIAAEESPAGSRAWIASVLTLFAGLGSGLVLWLLPIAGLGLRAWRIIFLVAALVLPVIWGLSRRLQESRRFDVVDQTLPPAPITSTMKRRFAMLATVGVALSMFSAPASNFQNEYLRETRGFSAARISLFSFVVNTPVGLGVAVAGPQADRRGRRLVGIIGILGGVGFGVLRYGFGGPLMWIAGGLSTVVGAATIPALGVYGPELFPTSRRGLANGLLTCVAVVGSVVGLVFVGQVTEKLGWSFGQAFGLLAIVPLLAVLVVARYPETAQRALEEINPEDPRVARLSARPSPKRCPS